jgi:hypothetical protein
MKVLSILLVVMLATYAVCQPAQLTYQIGTRKTFSVLLLAPRAVQLHIMFPGLLNFIITLLLLTNNPGLRRCPPCKKTARRRLSAQ